MFSKVFGLKLAMSVIFLTASIAFADDMQTAMDKNFDEADMNNDSRLTITEFHRFNELNMEDGIVRSAAIQRLRGERLSFDIIDMDKNGLITKDELRQVPRPIER